MLPLRSVATLRVPIALSRAHHIRKIKIRPLSGWSPSRFDPYSQLRSVIRDMERTFDHLTRDIGHPFSVTRALPVFSTQARDGSNTYRLNIDLHDFKPENIKVNLNGRVLQIQAKMDHTGEDGSRFAQEISREYTIPEKVDINHLKSILDGNGVLCIEAPITVENKSQEIPINRSANA